MDRRETSGPPGCGACQASFGSACPSQGTLCVRGCGWLQTKTVSDDASKENQRGRTELIAETVLRSGEAEGIAQRGWLQRREANIEAEHGLNVTLAPVAVSAGAGGAAGGPTRTRPEDPGRRDGGVGVAV